MTDTTKRQVNLVRTEHGRYRATNARGGELAIGSGADDEFTPVELLLAAIAACSSIDVDFIVSRRCEPQTFQVTSRGDKVREGGGSRMERLAVDFRISFADVEGAVEARQVLPRAVAMSRDRLCTVSRTVQVGTEVTMTVGGAPV